jgi:hypothetical protein
MTYHNPNVAPRRVVASPYAVAKQNQARAAIARMSMSGLGQTTTPDASLLPPPVQEGGVATGLKIGWAAVALLAIGIFWYTANPPHSVIGNTKRRTTRKNAAWGRTAAQRAKRTWELALHEYDSQKHRANAQTRDWLLDQVVLARKKYDEALLGGRTRPGLAKNRTVVTPGRISMIEERLRRAKTSQEQRKAIHSAQYALEDLYEYAPDSPEVKRIRRSINATLGFRQNRGRRKSKLAKNRYYYYANPSRRVKPNRYWYYANKGKSTGR